MKPQRGKTPKKAPAVPPKPKQTEPVEVYSRVRPLDDPDIPVCLKVISPTSLQLAVPEGSCAARNAGLGKETIYTFSYVFDEYSSQKNVFDHVAYPLCDDVLKGKNALLFAYGVTGSGKTHTMAGIPQDQGVLPRCMDVIFNSIAELQAKKYVFRPDKLNGYDVQSEADAMLERQQRDIMPRMTNTKASNINTPRIHGRHEDMYNKQKEPRVKETAKVDNIEEDNNYGVFVSYCEIYNNYIYDLLEDLIYDPITGYKPPQSKILREDPAHQMYVSGITEVEVKTTEDAYEVLNRGQKRRKVAQTSLNAESSRSHSVFNIRVVQAPLDPLGEEVLVDKDQVVMSQLSLVDLAGSERMVRTNNTGDRVKEAGNINQSLMVLRTCIEALRENQLNNMNKMVPYRDSRLTHLFKNYFDGEGKVRMIVCCSPKAVEYDETIHVMRFAELTQEVQVNRQQQVRFDVGMTRGRRKIAQQYKDALQRGEEDGTDSDGMYVPEPMMYDLGPPFPSLEMMDIRDDVTLNQLAEYLHLRGRRRIPLIEDNNRKWDKFRESLVELEKRNQDLELKVAELENKVTNKDSETGRLQKRVRSLEKNNENLHRTTASLTIEKREMERELDDKEVRIHQVRSEQYRLKNDYRTKIAMTEQNFKKDLEVTKRKLQEQTASQLAMKQQKIEMARNLLESDSSDNHHRTPSASSLTINSSRISRYGTPAPRIYPAKSEPDLSMKSSSTSSVPTSAQSVTRTPLTHTRARTAYTPNIKFNRIPLRSNSRPKSPPPTKPKPIVKKNHRRSRSQGDIYLHHIPTETIETGSLLQPKMRKKKSVSKLDKKDMKDTNKYLLTQQELDSDGGVATKLVKGNVMRTSAGGTSVVFTEVETLKQKSPGDRKRRSPPLRPEDYEGEWTDTDERCRIAIEGHGHTKRLRTYTAV